MWHLEVLEVTESLPNGPVVGEAGADGEAGFDRNAGCDSKWFASPDTWRHACRRGHGGRHVKCNVSDAVFASKCLLRFGFESYRQATHIQIFSGPRTVALGWG